MLRRQICISYHQFYQIIIIDPGSIASCLLDCLRPRPVPFVSFFSSLILSLTFVIVVKVVLFILNFRFSRQSYIFSNTRKSLLFPSPSINNIQRSPSSQSSIFTQQSVNFFYFIIIQNNTINLKGKKLLWWCIIYSRLSLLYAQMSFHSVHAFFMLWQFER